MVDKAPGQPLRDAWRSLGRRVAVAGGSAIAFLALFHHVPASTAALRGGATWLALLLATRLGAYFLERASALDREAPPEPTPGARAGRSGSTKATRRGAANP